MTFDCPACLRRHCHEDVYGRAFVCEGRMVYFDESHSPSLEPPPGHPSLRVAESWDPGRLEVLILSVVVAAAWVLWMAS